MNILKKRLLPILLATCISTGTVSTCDAGWDFWNNATVKSCVATCMTKLGFLKSKNTLVVGGVVLVGAIVAGILYRIKNVYSNNIDKLGPACEAGDLNWVKSILRYNGRTNLYYSILNCGMILDCGMTASGVDDKDINFVERSPLCCAIKKQKGSNLDLIEALVGAAKSKNFACDTEVISRKYLTILFECVLRNENVFDENGEQVKVKDVVFKYIYNNLLKNYSVDIDKFTIDFLLEHKELGILSSIVKENEKIDIYAIDKNGTGKTVFERVLDLGKESVVDLLTILADKSINLNPSYSGNPFYELEDDLFVYICKDDSEAGSIDKACKLESSIFMPRGFIQESNGKKMVGFHFALKK